jgi:hypothetical protein
VVIRMTVPTAPLKTPRWRFSVTMMRVPTLSSNELAGSKVSSSCRMSRRIGRDGPLWHAHVPIVAYSSIG